MKALPSSLVLFSLLATAVTAQPYYWDPAQVGGIGSGGSGLWDTSTPLFSNGTTAGVVWNNSTNDTAIFGTTSGNVTLATSIVAGGLIYNADYSFVVPTSTTFAVTGMGPGAMALNAQNVNLVGTTPTSVFQIGGANAITGTGTLGLNGITVQVTGTALSTSVPTALLGSGSYSVINTNGLGASWSGGITGLSNGLVKTGAGDLALSGTNQIGSVLVTTGSMTQTTGSISSFEIAVGTGAGGNATFNFGGTGTINMLTGTPPPLVGGSASSLRVGDFGGTGLFNQTGGTVNVSGSLNIGNQGGNGTYAISAGTLNLADGLYNLGRKANPSTASASTGVLNLSGSGLVNVVNGNFILGSRDNGALASTSNGTINQTGGTFRFNGVGGADNLFLSGYGNGTYNLSGGTLEIGGNALQGSYAGSGTYNFNLGGGTIRVINAGLTTSVNANLVANTYSFIDTNSFASTWSGSFTGAAGGLVKLGAGDLNLGSATHALGSFLVAGGSVTQGAGIINSSEIAVGTGAGNTAVYNFNGGTINMISGTPPPLVGGSASSLRVGDFGGTGTFTQNGGTINVSGSFNVGNQGGNGTYNLFAGTLNLADGLYNLGRKANPSTASASTGVLNLAGTGVLNLQSGAFILGSRDPGALSAISNGTINQIGGTFHVNGTSPADALYLSGYGNGTYNLNGGALEVGGNALQTHFGPGSGTYSFNMGGGTLRVVNATLNSAVNVGLTGAYSVIDTNGFGANWSGNINGPTSGFVKAGAGTLALSGTNFFASLLVTGGNVSQATGSNGSYEIAVGTGAGNTASYTMTGGTINMVAGTPPPLVGGSASSLRVGDFGGTGQFDQSGGTVAVNGSLNIGNQGGTGVYNLSGGVLDLANGLYNLGRKQTTSNANPSTGTLNVSGTGLVNVQSGAFILGSRDNGTAAAASSGTVNQSGGTFRVNGTSPADALYLSGYGNGTYNLNGGALEVGGNALQTHFGPGGGTYAFNLGGGTVRVINAPLNSGVNTTLVAATNSTIDTNSLGANWSGNVTGAGSLTKVGTGTLTLAGNNSYTGTTTINGGVLRAAGTPGAPALGGTSAVVINVGGTLQLAAESQVNSAAPVTLAGGAIDTGGFNPTFGTLAVTGFGSIIDMAAPGQNVVSFADSSSFSWSGQLSIYNWTGLVVNHTTGGDVFSGNAAEQLLFGNNPAGLTSAQLASISFFSDAGLTFLGTAESLGAGGNIIAAIPEPTTWLAAGLMLGTLAWTQRRRLRRAS